MSTVKLGERIQSLRSMATGLYDKRVAEGLDPVRIQEEIKPIQDALSKIILDAVNTDPSSVVMAAVMFESFAEAHKKDARYLLQKAKDAREHANRLKAALAEKMKADGQTELLADDFFASLSEDGTLSVR